MPKRTHSAGSSSGLPGAYRARNKNKFYVEGRQELARAITLDEKKRYKDAMEHYIKAMAEVVRRFRGNPTVLGYEIMNEVSSRVYCSSRVF